MEARLQHPWLRHIERQENLWARDKEQAQHRANAVLCALIEAGFVPDGEVWHGMASLKKIDA